MKDPERQRLVDLSNLIVRNSCLLKDEQVEDLLLRYGLSYNQPTVAEYRLVSIVAAVEQLLLERTPPKPPSRPTFPADAARMTGGDSL